MLSEGGGFPQNLDDIPGKARLVYGSGGDQNTCLKGQAGGSFGKS